MLCLAEGCVVPSSTKSPVMFGNTRCSREPRLFFAWAGVSAGAIGRSTEVIDDELGAFPGQHEGVLAADTSTGAGDNGDSAFTKLAHYGIRSWM